jgi:hypothetical protein
MVGRLDAELVVPATFLEVVPAPVDFALVDEVGFGTCEEAPVGAPNPEVFETLAVSPAFNELA